MSVLTGDLRKVRVKLVESNMLSSIDSQQINTLIWCRQIKSKGVSFSEYKQKSKRQDIKMKLHRNKTSLLSSLTTIQNELNKREQLKWRHLLYSLLAIFSIIQLVVCQDFEDLNINNSNKQTLSNGQLAHHSFQPLNRLPAQQQAVQQSSTTSNSRYTMQRPILSSRFAPSYSPTSASSQANQLAAQASSSSSIFSGPPNSMSVALQSQKVSGESSGSGSVSNIEQLMKNALARTAQLNSAASAEPRQDTVAVSQQQPEAPIQSTSSRSSASMQQAVAASSVATSAATSAQLAKEAASSKQEAVDKNAESSETLASETQPANGQSPEDSDKSTTAAQATTTSGHDTIYSNQRFANLFARRGNNKKSRITPSEQVKAKPTLPSFIKSPPDPKQFSATQAVNQENVNSNGNNNNNRPASGSNSFASQRLQGQNQNRLNQINNQQKKPVITSTSAANANNKRVNSQVGKQISSPNNSSNNPKLASLNLNKPSTSKPNSTVTPSNNNPFNRSQQGNSGSDSANVIAMARKRLLTNNALESAKLKQQQQQQKQTN